jgi:hypothetical protein
LRQLHARAGRSGTAADDRHPRGDEVLAIRLRPAEVRFTATIVALAALWLAMLAFGAGPLDRRIYELLYAGHRPVLAAIARGVTFLGEPTVLIGAGLVCALWLWWRERGRLGLVLLLIVLIGRTW